MIVLILSENTSTTKGSERLKEVLTPFSLAKFIASLATAVLWSSVTTYPSIYNHSELESASSSTSR